MSLRSALEPSDGGKGVGKRGGRTRGPDCREGGRGEIKPRAQPVNAAARVDPEISLRPLIAHVVVVHHLVPRLRRRGFASRTSTDRRGRFLR